MKKMTLSLLLILLLVLSFPVQALAASPSFELYYSLDKDFYEVGETVTVQLCLDRSDGSGESYSMYSFEDDVLFDPTYLEYQDSSDNANNADKVRVSSKAVYYNKTYYRIGVNYNAMGNPDTRVAKLVVAELEFKAIAQINSSMLRHSSPAVSTAAVGKAALEAADATYTIGNPAAPTFAVSFSGGSGATGSAPDAIAEKAAGDVFVLPANTYTKAGFSFIGWSDGSKSYAAAESYTMPGTAVVFTAQWSADPVPRTITFTGGQGATGTAPVLAAGQPGTTVALPTCTFVKKDYSFAGWAYGGASYQPGDIFTRPDANVVFTASWTALTPEAGAGTIGGGATGTPGGATTVGGGGAAGGTVATDGSGAAVTPQGPDVSQIANPFTDVALTSSTSWYYANVLWTCDKGLIDGFADKTFRPDDNLSLAQAVKLAACMNQSYATGAVTLTNGSPQWYSSYVAYAIEKGIISEGQFTDYNATATRAQFAAIFAAALPEAAYAQINTVNDNKIPDVPSAAASATSVYKLYRAGVLVGSDGAGSFLPDNNIRRSEVATILTRMMDATYRQTITLE